MLGGESEYPPLLPVGFHPMPLENLRRMCVDRFPDSLTRQAIMDGLTHVLGELNRIGLGFEVWVDGSFLTEKLNPKDCDFVVKVAGEEYDNASLSQQQAVAQIARADLKGSYRCDCYVFPEYADGHPLHAHGQWRRAYWLRQFGFSRSVEPKGLAVINLPYIIT